MDDLLADFIEETREMLEASESEIVAWEANPADRARLDTIFRFVHTVKGNCGFFDFPRLEKLSHAAEDALADVRSGRLEANSQLVTAVLAIIDRIADMVTAIEKDIEFPEGGDDALIAALEVSNIEQSEITQPRQIAGPDDTSGSPDTDNFTSATPRSIRLPVELLDRVMSGVSDIVLARNELAHRLKEAGTQPTVDGPFERLSSILNDVRDAITRMRMQRIENLYTAIPRLIRDLSNDLGKQVMVDLEGGDVELDREMIEMVRDPITHIIRNAIDHGFETPSERMKAGKHEIGVISISARQAGNKISISISDDGRGLNEAKIVEKAITAEAISQSDADEMSREQMLDLVFTPGLSTAEEVSAVSGRGVGLDVVRDNLEKVGGEICVASMPGEGTVFQLQIPLTLSIIAGLTLDVGSHRFVVPQSYVEEIVRLRGDSDAIEDLGDTVLVTFREQRLKMISLGELLRIERKVERENSTLVILKLASGDLFALAVDRVHASSDIVVKPIPPAIMESGLYCGSTLLDDGQPILLLDIPRIAESNGLTSDARRRAKLHFDDAENPTAGTAVRAMLFNTLDNQKRLVRLELVKRIETIDVEAIDFGDRTYRAVIDDEILPVIGIENRDALPAKIRLLRLTDGLSEILYAVDNIEDTVEIESELVPVDDTDSLIEAVTLIDGQSIQLLDSHQLFAAYGAIPKAARSKTCAIPDTDWAKSILAPLIEAAGYVPTFSDDVSSSDILITVDQPEAVVVDTPAIALRSEPDDQVSEDERRCSIYRYDRERLLSALRVAGKEKAA